MGRLLVLPLVVSLGLVGACAKETLVGRQPSIDVDVYSGTGETYADFDDTAEIVEIDLGDVAVYSSARARFLLRNDSLDPLKIIRIGVREDTKVGEIWEEPVLEGMGPDGKAVIPGSRSRFMDIVYGPNVVGPALVEVEIFSNAGNAPTTVVRVKANGVFQGAPDVDIRLHANTPSAQSGPSQNGCDENLTDGNDDNGDGVVDGCKMQAALDFGSVGLSSQGAARLFVRNAASCPPFPSAEPCDTCVLILDKDPTRLNLGVGFKAGTNDAGLFAFQGSTATPAAIPQVEPDCTQNNVVPLVVIFDAPGTIGTYTATIVIESNDPDEPLVEIPVTANSVNAPVAIAGLRAFDPGNTTAPFTNPDDIKPLDIVYLDGRAKGSTTSTHDPNDPSNTALITQFEWEALEWPAGTLPSEFQPNGQGTGLYSAYLPLAGHYVFRLTVTNADGLRSLDTPESRVEFDAIPSDHLHVQLVWDNPSNDQDLHLTKQPGVNTLCICGDIPYCYTGARPDGDCYFANKSPRWFATSPKGEGANPILDIDDTNGLGPENINIETPEPGTYRIFVHYWGDQNSNGTPATGVTVRVWLNGLQVAQYKRILPDEEAVWAVADINWINDGSLFGTGVVIPYPSDTTGEVGAVDWVTSDCLGSGQSWTFP